MGRPATFDRETVLEQAVQLFWSQGYGATSIMDLVAVTRLNPGSIYNTFRSKQQMLLEALDRYGRGALERVKGARRPTALATLEVFFAELVQRSLDDPEARGCFLVNTWLELSPHDPEACARIEGVFDDLETEFRDRFIEARERGELKPGADPVVLAKFVMMSVWGLRVMSRSRPGRETLEALVEQVLVSVRHAAV